MSLTFTDIFCGAGGSSIGLTEAGFDLRLAANHWDRAIETHSANFRDAEHLCADVNNYDMRRLPRTDVLWASPICTESSPAGKRRGRRKAPRGQLDLLAEEGPVAQAGFERTRATFHDVIRATEVHRYAAVLVENVPDVAEEWELFDWWVQGMTQLRPGYRVQYVSVSSAHIGGPGNPHAPQWRDRLYLVFTRTGIPLPNVDPRPLARCPDCGCDVAARQSWRKPGARRIGRYRRQYDYRCPNTVCRHAIVEPYVLPATTAIDWSDLGQRIGDRNRPLVPSTMARIEYGITLFAEPTMIAVNHDDPTGRAYPAAGAPLPTRTVKIGDGLACPPFTVPSGGTWRTDSESLAMPMPTRTTTETDLLICPPFIAELRGGGSTARRVDDPLATITAGGNHHGLTIPPGAFLTKNFGHLAPKFAAKSVDEHVSTITARDHHALVVPYRKGKAKTTAEPIHTLATRDSAALVQPAIDINDCRFRMLQPREHLRAQRFPDTYTVTGNKSEQTMQAGNAVSANVAHWIGTQLAAALDNRRGGEVAA